MYVIKCIKPGKSYGISVKEGTFLADERENCEFTSNLNKAFIFISRPDAKFHIQMCLATHENTALFTVCELELKVKR